MAFVKHVKKRKRHVCVTHTGCVLVGQCGIVYDIVRHLENAGRFATVEDVQALYPRHVKLFQIRLHVWRLLREGHIEVVPETAFRWKRGQALHYRMKRTSTVFTRLTPSGVYLRGRDLRYYHLIEGLREKLGYSPSMRDVSDMTGVNLYTLNKRLKDWMLRGIYEWDDKRKRTIRLRQTPLPSLRSTLPPLVK